MKYIFRSLRFILGYLIYAFDWLTRPAWPKYPAEKRAELDAATSNMALYQFKLCPFCVKARRKIRQLGLNIEMRDARNDPKWNAELVNEGGRYQVPCLRVTDDSGNVSWLYESTAINDYLDERFHNTAD